MNNKEIEVPINQNDIEKALESFGISPSILLGEEAAPASKGPTFFQKAVEKGANSELVKGEENDLGGGEDQNPRSILLKGLGFTEEMFDNFEKASDIIKGFGDYQASIEKRDSEQQTLIKGLTDSLSAASEFNKGLVQRIETIEKTPLPRKSITSSAIEKNFNGGEGNDLKKGEEMNVFSLTKNRKQILNMLEAKAELGNLEKGGQSNPLFTNALLSYETSGILPKDVITELNKENIAIVQ